MRRLKIAAPMVFLLFMTFCLGSGPASAADTPPVPRQKLLRGHWSEDKSIMRNNHQALLRDRMNATYPLSAPQQHTSIEQCVTCHVTRGAENLPVSADDPGHFCRDCHARQRVSLDCFSCHASLPASDPRIPAGEVKNADSLKRRLAQHQAAQGGKK
jgi:hypothetical protein